MMTDDELRAIEQLGIINGMETATKRLVAEVRQLQEQVVYQASLAREQGDRIRGLNEQIEQAKSEWLEVELAARMVDDAYWHRVEWMAGALAAGYATRDVMISPYLIFKEARALIDEIDRQRRAAD
jgi:hypothetical protein